MYIHVSILYYIKTKVAFIIIVSYYYYQRGFLRGFTLRATYPLIDDFILTGNFDDILKKKI